MINKQPIEKLDRKTDGSLEVHSIFPTIQGEGPWAGTPAVFVRLAGCTLQCPYCDTDYTSNRQVMTPLEVVQAVFAVAGPSGLVVFTGGEPFRQNVKPTFCSLLNHGCRVQVETNGTVPFHLWNEKGEKKVSVICSPKTPNIELSLCGSIHAYKYIVEEGGTCPDDGLPTRSLGYGKRVFRPPPTFNRHRIFIQPCDEKDEERNSANLEEAVQVCMKFGYRLSIQTHKIAGLK